MAATHPMLLEVVLPSTGVPVRELLTALAKHLAADAERYMKAHKVNADHPAVADKADAAEAITDLVRNLAARSKRRWDEANGRREA